jgi:hypothetical protein
MINRHNDNQSFAGSASSRTIGSQEFETVSLTGINMIDAELNREDQIFGLHPGDAQSDHHRALRKHG